MRMVFGMFHQWEGHKYLERIGPHNIICLHERFCPFFGWNKEKTSVFIFLATLTLPNCIVRKGEKKKEGMERAEMIFIPGPGMGHLVPAVQFGKLLTERDERLSIVIIVVKFQQDTQIDSGILFNLVDDSSRISFLNIDLDKKSASEVLLRFLAELELMNSYKPQIREAIHCMTTKINKNGTTRIAGVVVDIFSLAMIDLANEFQLPSYVFFTSGAAFLGLGFHVQTLKEEYNQEVSDYKEMSVPTFRNPVPVMMLPTPMLKHLEVILQLPRSIRKSNGILINTFLELEQYALDSLSDQNGKIPRIYPIGPILNHKYKPPEDDDGIMSWLDNQPTASVVFLCFGSLGSCFNKEQVKEIAIALEHCGYRFLWTLRRPPANAPESSCTDPEEVLPEGFLERTSGRGKVIRWAPQVAILGHPAVGGFVSHCGWNSILEATWFGVPIAAWPLHAEQQVNAFQMIVELEIAAEIKMDYRHDENHESNITVTAEEIEKGIKSLMMDESKNEKRKKFRHLKEKSHKAMMDHGSSKTSLANFIDDVFNMIPKLGQEKNM